MTPEKRKEIAMALDGITIEDWEAVKRDVDNTKRYCTLDILRVSGYNTDVSACD